MKTGAGGWRSQERRAQGRVQAGGKKMRAEVRTAPEQLTSTATSLNQSAFSPRRITPSISAHKAEVPLITFGKIRG